MFSCGFVCVRPTKSFFFFLVAVRLSFHFFDAEPKSKKASQESFQDRAFFIFSYSPLEIKELFLTKQGIRDFRYRTLRLGIKPPRALVGGPRDPLFFFWEEMTLWNLLGYCSPPPCKVKPPKELRLATDPVSPPKNFFVFFLFCGPLRTLVLATHRGCSLVELPTVREACTLFPSSQPLPPLTVVER